MYPNPEEMSTQTEKKPAPLDCRKVFANGVAKRVPRWSQRAWFCGREVETKRLWVSAGLILLFLMSFIGTVLMWFTNTFDEAILANLPLRNGSLTYDLWRKPPVQLRIKLHVFNYTNVDEYISGAADKLHVEDIGPFTYEESLERVHVAPYPDGTLSYQERRSYKFRPDLSVGRKQSDQLVVPNLSLMNAAAYGRDSNFLTRMSLVTIMESLNAKPFLKLPAQKFFFGYDDHLFDLAKGVLAFKHELPFEKFGMMSAKNGIAKDVFRIYSGETGMRNLGTIKSVNGQSSLGHWSTDDCDGIAGTDGTIHPPHLVRAKQPLTIFLRDTCRKFPMHFDGETRILDGKIPVYKYSLPKSVFDNADTCPEHQCYCNLNSGACPPQGFHNATPCALGTPLFLSFPHWYNADPEISETIGGLSPTKEMSESFILVHPKYGMAVSGRMRMQMNVQVRRSFGMKQLDFFEDDLLLPVAWSEMSLEDVDLPDEIVDLLYLSTFTVRNIELALQYICLLTTLTTLIGLVIVLRGKIHDKAASYA